MSQYTYMYQEKNLKNGDSAPLPMYHGISVHDTQQDVIAGVLECLKS